jgi:hypothetical protein
MAGRGGQGGRKILVPPINFIFKLLQQQSVVSIWTIEQTNLRVEGKIRVRHTLYRHYMGQEHIANNICLRLGI